MKSTTTTPQSHTSPRSGKRKLSEEKHEHATRGDQQKRAQNRAAQKSFREKQHIHLQYLESFVKAVKSSEGGSDENDRYSRILRTHLKLLEDYHKLQHAYIRLRQKLSGIGQSATAAAGELCETLHLAWAGFVICGTDDKTIDELLAAHANNDFDEGTPVEHQLKEAGQESAYARIISPHQKDGELRDQSAGPDSASPPSAVQQGDVRLGNNFMEGTVVSNIELAMPSSALPHDPSQISTMLLKRSQDLELSPNLGISSRYNDSFVLIQSKTVFADKVEAACKRYITKFQLGQLIGNETPSSSTDCVSTRLIGQLTSAAINLIGDSSGLIGFIYGSEFYKSLEHILQWRLCKTFESRFAIDKVFQPTQLQNTLANHPIIIDFIAWPSIRDQMILNMQIFDLDILCRELTMNTVVEVPGQRMAVSVYDYIVNAVSSEWHPVDTGTQTCLDTPTWTYVQSSLDLAYGTSLDPAEDVIVQELANRIQSFGIKDITTSGAQFTHSRLSFRPRPSERQEDSTLQSAVYQVSNWKISQEFAKKWPLFDCSGGEFPLLLGLDFRDRVKFQLKSFLLNKLLVIAKHETISYQLLKLLI